MTLTWMKIGGDGAYRYDNIVGMDPAANWLLGPGRGAFLPDAGEDALVPTTFHLRLPRDTTEAARPLDESAEVLLRILRQVAASAPAVGLPKKLLDRLAAPDGDAKTAVAMDADRQFSWTLKISSPRDISPVPDLDSPPLSELGAPPPSIPAGGWPPGTVVMAVIDDSVGFAHEAFRNADGTTRIQYWWQQDGDAPTQHRTVQFGREIGKNGFVAPSGQRSGIDEMLSDAARDEAAVYREAGLADFSLERRPVAALRRSHGTHVLDVAAGYRPDDAASATRPLIAVQLPFEVVDRSSGAELDFYVVKAMEYILHRAAGLTDSSGAALPVVITMSYGFIAGPHDGTTPLELAIDNLLRGYDASNPHLAQMVLSAGNSQLSRCHAEFVFTPQCQTVELQWMVLPDDRTSSSLEIWLPRAEGASNDCRVEVSVISPAGVESTRVPEEQGHTVRLVRGGSTADADAAAEIKYAFVPGMTQRGMFRITLAPTEHLAGDPGPWAGHALAPAGVWRVRIHRVNLAWGEPINAWIQRDDTIYGYRQSGRQSHFVNPCYLRFDAQGRRIVEDAGTDADCPVRRRALLSAIATGEQVIVAGAYKQREQDIADYSAGGPTTQAGDVVPLPPLPRKPDALMVAEGSRVHRGLLAAGTLSGSVMRMGGTSAAAPGLARWLADHPELGARDGRTLVREGAEADEGPTGAFAAAPALSPERGGWGRVLSRPRRIRVKRGVWDGF